MSDLDLIRSWRDGHSDFNDYPRQSYMRNWWRDVDTLLTVLDKRDAEMLELRDATPEPLLTGKVVLFLPDLGVLALGVEPTEAMDLAVGTKVGVWPEGCGPLSETEQVRVIEENDSLRTLIAELVEHRCEDRCTRGDGEGCPWHRARKMVGDE